MARSVCGEPCLKMSLKFFGVFAGTISTSCLSKLGVKCMLDNSLYILVGKKPVSQPDTLKWGKWMQEADRHVAKTYYKNLFVSTVFLGMDHGWGRGAPVLFETMVFDESGKGKDKTIAEFFERYCTWGEAEAGHRKIVSKLMGLI